jgi:cysteine-rich repeat protein
MQRLSGSEAHHIARRLTAPVRVSGMAVSLLVTCCLLVLSAAQGGAAFAVCGDGILDPGEQCDDGNLNNCDGCSASCRTELVEGSWCAAGGPEGGDLLVLAVDPNTSPTTLYAPGGAALFKSPDGGQTWFASDDGISGTSVVAMAVSPADSSLVLAFTSGFDSDARPPGIYRTADGGQNWGLVWNRAGGWGEWTITFDPTYPAVVYAAGGYLPFVKSVDGGRTWTETPAPALSVFGIAAASLGTATKLYTWDETQIYGSPDGGVTWYTTAEPGRTFPLCLAVDPMHAERVYVGYDNGMIRTTDGGTSWSAVDAFAGYRVTSLAFAPSDPSVLYAGTDADRPLVMKSLNGGDSWTATGYAKAAGPSSLAVDPHDARTLYTASLLGMVKSSDGGSTWSESNEGLHADVVNAFAYDQSSGRLYAGTESVGVWVGEDHGTKWSAANVGLPNGWYGTFYPIMDLQIDPQQPTTLYAVIIPMFAQDHSIFKSTDAGATWVESGSGLPGGDDEIGTIAELAIDPIEPSTLYLPGGFKSTDGGASWFLPSIRMPSVRIAMDPTAPNILYTHGGDISGDIFKTTNGGSTWATVGSLPENIGKLLVDPSAPTTLLAAGNGLFKSADGGASWRRVMSGDFGALTARGSTLYASNIGQGIYVSMDSGDTWALEADPGLKNTRIYALAFGDAVSPSAPSILATRRDGIGSGRSTAARLQSVINGTAAITGPAAAFLFAGTGNAGGAGGVFRKDITPCTSDAECDDGSVCNGVETCVNTVCLAGTPLVCPVCEGCDPVGGCQVDQSSITCGVGACTRSVPKCIDGVPQTCTPGTPGVEGPVGSPSCSNGIDDDCDGLTDANDPGCQELISGGSGATDCAHEWRAALVPARNKKGMAMTRQACTEGDPTCDFGPADDLACTFHVAMCFNVAEQRFTCTPTDVARVQLLQPPEAQPKDATAMANRDALETALEGRQGVIRGQCRRPRVKAGQLCQSNADCDSTPGNGLCKGRFVAFEPPLSTTNACTAFASISVPLRETARGLRSGTTTLKLKASPSNDPVTSRKRPKDTDLLTLVCKPQL